MRVCPKCQAVADSGARFCARCGGAIEVSAQDPLIGRTIAGSYVVLELVGVGGMGRVYRAEHSMLGRSVAIKFIHPHLLGDESSVARFYSEARAASRLNHPHSVSVMDFGRTDEGLLFLVMEFLRGHDLAHAMRDEGPLPFDRICDILLSVLAALGEAHALGVVHRDVKPENIILEKSRNRELVKVVDFGLAKLTESLTQQSTSITSPGFVCGTPDYMSPEQGRGETIDGRGDLYAVGVVLFELLTEHLPYADDTAAKLVLRHISDPIPDPREVAQARGIPDGLALIAMRAMRKRREDRYQTADAMSDALREFLRQHRSAGPAPVCPSCGGTNTVTARFCSECGARLQQAMSMPAGGENRISQVSLRPGPSESSRAPLIGREDLIKELRARIQSSSTPDGRHIHLVGETGVGKSRVVSHLALLARENGDATALVMPHPTGVPIALGAARSALSNLCGTDARGLQAVLEHSQSGTRGDVLGQPLGLGPVEHAGLRELLSPGSFSSLDGKRRDRAILSLARHIIRIRRPENGRVCIFVDDIHRTDGASKRLLLALAKEPYVVLVTSGNTPVGDAASQVLVQPLRTADAQKLLTGLGDGARLSLDALGLAALDVVNTFSPLLVEQARALSVPLFENGAPVRVADLLTQRIGRLDLPTLRLAQAAATLGTRTKISHLARLADAHDMAFLDRLTRSKLTRIEGDEIIFEHNFVRDLIEGSTPMQVRCAHHLRAYEIAADLEMEPEVRVEHALRSGEALIALLAAENMGDQFVSRSETEPAISMFRRGLELARREAAQTGLATFDRAVATFSRKLGDALERAGDATGADGIVREALDLTERGSSERVRMLLVLARAASQRNRIRDGTRIATDALKEAEAQKDPDPILIADAYLALAMAHRKNEDLLGAANALRLASASFSSLITRVHDDSILVRRATALVDLAELLVELDDCEDATRYANEARALARQAGAKAIEARAISTLATLASREKDVDTASSLNLDASALALASGDLDLADDLLIRSGSEGIRISA